MEYKLVAATTVGEFEDAVNAAAEDGFTPHAHLNVTPDTTPRGDYGMQYTILMVRPKPQKED